MSSAALKILKKLIRHDAADACQSGESPPASHVPASVIPSGGLDAVAAGYDPKQDPSVTDPYWSPLDLPAGSTAADKGYLGKSNA